MHSPLFLSEGSLDKAIEGPEASGRPMSSSGSPMTGSSRPTLRVVCETAGSLLYRARLGRLDVPVRVLCPEEVVERAAGVPKLQLLMGSRNPVQDLRERQVPERTSH